jgi:hypothetical protein
MISSLRRVALAIVLCLGGCSAARPATPHFQRVIFNPEPSHGPYVVVAVDNHFHDIHPIDDPSIASHRAFVVKNEGFNLHNFTVIGTTISIDLKPGDVLRWRHLGNHLQPGTYHVVCAYHADQRMRGIFTVTK